MTSMEDTTIVENSKKEKLHLLEKGPPFIEMETSIRVNIQAKELVLKEKTKVFQKDEEN